MNIVYFLFAVIGTAILILVSLWWLSPTHQSNDLTFPDGLLDIAFLCTGTFLGVALAITGLSLILGY